MKISLEILAIILLTILLSIEVSAGDKEEEGGTVDIQRPDGSWQTCTILPGGYITCQ